MDDHSMWFDRMLKTGEGYFLRLLEGAAHEVGYSDGFESPIEYVFATSAVATARLLRVRCSIESRRGLSLEDAKRAASTRLVEDTVYIAPQVTIGPYRVDFIVFFSGYPRGTLSGMVVECDGHEFHEKTKEQAKRDKARDRALQSLDLKVFRFTGSEIWHNPLEAAGSVIEHAHIGSHIAGVVNVLFAEGEVDAAHRVLRDWTGVGPAKNAGEAA